MERFWERGQCLGAQAATTMDGGNAGLGAQAARLHSGLWPVVRLCGQAARAPRVRPWLVFAGKLRSPWMAGMPVLQEQKPARAPRRAPRLQLHRVFPAFDVNAQVVDVQVFRFQHVVAKAVNRLG